MGAGKVIEKGFRAYSAAKAAKAADELVEAAGKGADEVAEVLDDVPLDKMKGKRPNKPEYPVKNSDGSLTEYGKWYYKRPSWRKDTIDDVWKNAKNSDGKVLDPPLALVCNE